MKLARLLKFSFTSVILCGCLLWPPAVLSQQSRQPEVERPGKPPGPETGAFFDEVQKRKQQLPPGEPSMADPFSLADLNRDGRCDRADLRLFRRVAGKCARPGSPALVTLADLDADGCVTREDRRSFLQLWRACKSEAAGGNRP